MGNAIDIPTDDFLQDISRTAAILSSLSSHESFIDRQTTISDDEQLQNLESISLIWLDRNIRLDKEDFRKTLRGLREINNFTRFYTDSRHCIDYIHTCGGEKIFIIISGALTKEEDILSEIQSAIVVRAIFIFCSEKSDYEKLLQLPKIVGIFIQQKPLVEAIQKQIEIVSKQDIEFSIFDKNKKSYQDLRDDSGSFFRFQLLFNLLKDMTPHPDSKDRMLEICEKYYHGKQSESKCIEEFRHYNGENAIAWYTKECFVYRLLNKALRTEDIDGLLLFHFFIIDLHNELKTESQCIKRLEEQRLKENGKFKLYRGQQMSEGEINKLEHSEGSLISPNGFFSTSVKKEVATGFLNRTKGNGYFPVLFEIKIDVSVKSSVYAYIEHLSEHKNESEVLFSLGTVFKISKVMINRDYDGEIIQCDITMNLTDEGTNNVKDYIDSMRSYYEGMNTSVIFGRLIIDIDEIVKAEKYFNLLRKSVHEDSLDGADILDEFGHIALRQMKNEVAVEYFKQAHALKLHHVGENHPKIALSLNNYGVLAFSSGKSKQAINYFQQTLDIFGNYGEKRSAWISKVQLNLADAYMANNESEKAYEYLRGSLTMCEKISPNRDCDIADILFVIGRFHYKAKNYDDAENHFLKALQKYEKILPAGHKKIIDVCGRIIYTYKAKCNNEVALINCEGKLHQFREKFGRTHWGVGQMLFIMGEIHQDSNAYEDARSYFQKARRIFEKCMPPDKMKLIQCLNRIAITYHQQHDYESSLKYFMQQLIIARRIYSSNHLEVARTLRNIGIAYSCLKIYQKGLSYLREALVIYKDHLPNDHDEIIKLRREIIELERQHQLTNQMLFFPMLLLRH